MNGVPQRRWAWLTEILRDLGHEVIVITPQPVRVKPVVGEHGFMDVLLKLKTSEVEIGPSGETIIRCGSSCSAASLTARVLNQVLVAASGVVQGHSYFRDEVKPDLIIGTVPALPTAAVTSVLAYLLKVPYMIDLRDAWPDLVGYVRQWNVAVGKRSIREKLLINGPINLISPIVSLGLNGILKHARFVSVTSDDLGDVLARRFEKEKNRNVVLIRNVFPTEVKQKPRKDTLGEVGELNLLYAGTIGRAQNLQNLIKAIELTQASGVQINLRIIGDGVAKDSLLEEARSRNVDFEYLPRMKAAELDTQYAWADSALVHLTDWEPLERTVPSKTYELIQMRIHITGVVAGETARIITSLNTGHTVSPERPKALAELLVSLANDPALREVSDEGAKWVLREQKIVTSEKIKLILDTLK